VNGAPSASPTPKPSLSTTATAASHVGSYALTASGAASPNYTITYVGGTLAVTPAPLTATADSKGMVYGGALPALTASYAGLVNGDTPAALTGLLLSTVPATSHAGTYDITAGGASDPDYAISYQKGPLTISPAALAITP